MKVKILLTTVVLLSLTTFVCAQNVGMDFGVNFFKPSNSNFETTNGNIFVIGWNVDSDVSFGILNETTDLRHQNAIGSLRVSGIYVQKKVVKDVYVGLNLGSATATLTNTVTRPLVDIYGKAILLSTKGDKIVGSLYTLLAGRFMNTSGLNAAGVPVDNLNGFNATIGVSIGF